MAASGIAVGFEWTPFSHGFVFWEYPGPEHLPPSDAVGQRLEEFQQVYADYPDEPYDPDHLENGETAEEALGRMLAGNPHLTALLDRLRGEWARSGRVPADTAVISGVADALGVRS